jgi:hypothetical protein
MLQVFHLDVAKIDYGVAIAIYIYVQVFVPNVSYVFFRRSL